MLIGSIFLFATGFAGNDHASVNLAEGGDLVSLGPYGACLIMDSDVLLLCIRGPYAAGT